ncbi:MAG: AAA family ATPase [Phycisphaeraceae bacterium]|nr:AAA family ATPase [Phycisphaerae bacterium]MBX3391876.1 AAA family ATPase [Phycisphaeraceae bacterium]
MIDSIEQLRANITRVFLGVPAAVDLLIVSLLARGHVLIEDVPGVGKTILAAAMARSINCSFSRIQLTPDLLPSDVIGVSVYKRDAEKFVFKPGPIFANIVLADEINRTPPRTQTALLEAMSEATVSVDGVTYTLEQPFMVVATQNPHDFEGTYALPENQLDRFLMKISLGYPSPQEEARVLDLRPAGSTLPLLTPVIEKATVLELQRFADAVRLDRTIADYVVAIANATRRDEQIRVGVSPRGSLALAQAARARAVLGARDYVIPEDVTVSVEAVCAHRIVPRNTSAGRDVAPAVLRSILQSVPSPD